MFGRRRKNEDTSAQLTRDQILQYLDGVLEKGGTEEKRIEARLKESPTDREFFEAVRQEIETQNLSIALVWRQEGISCPHRDILEGHHYGSLSAEESDYIRFHVERIGCQACAASLDDIRAKDKSFEEPAMRSLREDILRSTTMFLRSRKG